MPGEDPPDRRDRRDRCDLPGKVVGDGLGAGVMTGFGERPPQRQDGRLDLGAMLVRTRPRPPALRLEGRVAAAAKAADQLIDPGPRDPMAPRQLGRTAPLEHDVALTG